MAAVELSNASFRYGNQLIFNDINLAVGDGEVFCLLGPNGCGKTTLLDCVLGALKLEKGFVAVNGSRRTRRKASSMARQIAYIPQRHERTFPYKVLDIVAMGRAAYTTFFGSPSEDDILVSEEALELLGIRHLKDRPYTQLSGGEGQMVMIARALAQQTRFIIMDEPTAHLDLSHEMAILETIVALIRKKGISVIMATHFINHVFYFENKGVKTTVALLKDGGFMAVGAPRLVLNEENVTALYSVKARVISLRESSDSELRHVVPIGTLKGQD